MIGGVNPVVWIGNNEIQWDWSLLSCNDTSDDAWYMVDGSTAINGSDVMNLPCSTIAVSENTALAALDDISVALTERGIKITRAGIEERSDEGDIIRGLFTR